MQLGALSGAAVGIGAVAVTHKESNQSKLNGQLALATLGGAAVGAVIGLIAHGPKPGLAPIVQEETRVSFGDLPKNPFIFDANKYEESKR